MEKHAEIKALMLKLQEERASILAQTQPLHYEYDKLRQASAELETKARALADQFKAIERPRLAEIDNQLAALNRAIGGRSLKAEGGVYSAEVGSDTPQ